MSHPSRSALIDCFKGLACAAIVWHHLAYYGPLSEQLARGLPQLSQLLVEYARMAVQVFLVLGGFLAAASLSPRADRPLDASWAHLAERIGQRFMRLVVPYAAALALVVSVSAAVRPWFDDPAVSPAPDLAQLLAHAFLLHGVLGEESLSAGVWYVAIDFQLFGLSALLFALAAWLGCGLRVLQALIALLTAASLLFFNLDTGWDVWAVYFFGAYGLGMLAYWCVRAPRPLHAWLGGALIVALVLAALALQWRPRIALAGAMALTLVPALRVQWSARWQGWAPLVRLGQISYSVFLIHFALCLLVNAVVGQWWPDSFAVGGVALLAAFALSILAGHLLYEYVERHVPSWRSAQRWKAGMVGVGLLGAYVAADVG